MRYAVACIIALLGMMTPSMAQRTDGLQAHDGQPSLCNLQPITAESRSGSGPDGVSFAFTIHSTCGSLAFESLSDTLEKENLDTVHEWKKDLWDSGRLPPMVYMYELEIVNDRPADIDVNLGNWSVTHSPYTYVAKGFSFKIPACHKMKLIFESPWPPKIEYATINIGIHNDPKAGDPRGTYYTEGAGRTGILTPSWYQFYPGIFRTQPLQKTDVRSMGCLRSAL